MIGRGILDLSTLRHDQPVDGWVPLSYHGINDMPFNTKCSSPCISGKPAGAVRLEVEFSFTVISEVAAYMKRYMLAEAQPKDRPKFDVNALYGPGM